MTKLSPLVLLAVFASTQAFAPMIAPRTVARSTARHVLLSEEDTSAMISKANDCAEGECSVDDVDALIAELKAQQREMSSRLEDIMNMVAHLQHINEADARKKDDVRAYVKDLLRVFDVNTGGFATGFTGDIGDGPTTAYDALPPKPWKQAP